MASEQEKFTRNASAGTDSSPSTHNTGQNTGAAVAPKKDAMSATTAGTRETRIDTNKSLLDQAKATAGQAYDSVAEKAGAKLDEQKSSLSGGLASVADSVRKVGENLKGIENEGGIAKYTAEYSDAAAHKIEQVADYFERKDAKAMYRDVENFARTNPAIFIGGAFALGLLAARFLKSSNPKQLSKAAGQSFGSARPFESDYSSGESRSPSDRSSF